MDYLKESSHAELPVYKGQAGTPLPIDTKPLTDKEQIINAIKVVEDPDVGVDVYNLGLIYKINLDKKGNVSVDMTLTSPTCPYGAEMVQAVADSIANLDNVGEVNVDIVWQPAWNFDKMSEEAKYELDLF